MSRIVTVSGVVTTEPFTDDEINESKQTLIQGLPRRFGSVVLTGASIAGLYGFGKYQDDHRTAALSDPQLCDIARQRKLDGVYVLNSISATADNRFLRCAH